MIATLAAAAVPILTSPAPTRLSTLDLAIVALYLLAITLFGLRFSRKNKQSEAKSGSSLKSYFLAGNTIPWWAIALSIVSAETSTLTIVSIPGVAFGGDFGFLQIVLGYMLGRIVVAGLFLPKYFRGEMLTAYQLIDRRFGPTLHKVTAGLFLLTRAAAEGVRVFAISIVVGIAIGTGDTLSILLISALTLLYTFEGGMAAVIWTDVVQMALYVAGTLVALFTLGHSIPGGWSQIHAVAAPQHKFHMLNFALNLTQAYTFWAGILGGTFLTMASHGTDQLMVQRMLAARNLRESRLALLSSGVVIFLQFTLFLLIGVGLFVFYGNAGAPGAPRLATETWVHHSSIAGLSPDRIFPTFIVREMPHGIAGLLIAAILAAAMSNLSAALNSLASTTVVDFYVPWRSRLNRRPTPNGQQTTDNSPSTPLISRLATIAWAILLFLIAVYSIQHGGKGHVVETGLSIASVAYGCLLGVFLLGTLTSPSSKYGATQSGAILGMICGFALNLTLWLPTITPIRHLGPIPIPKVAFTWYVLLGALVTFAIGTVASYMLPKPRPRTFAASVLAFVFLFVIPAGNLRLQAQTSAIPQPATHPAFLKSTASAVPSAATTPSAALAAEGTPSQTYDFSQVSTLIQTAIADHKLPGAVVLIGHNGQIVFHHAYGNRSIEPSIEPMTEDTLFDMASLTKVLVTTTAILQLYEQHKLDPVLGLDTPIATYLPAFAATPKDISEPKGQRPYLYQPGPQTQVPSAEIPRAEGPTHNPATQAWKSQITIRQLLTHYSGLPEDIDLKDDWGLTAPDKAEGIHRALAAIPYGPPGQIFKYSDINFITLGALVEKLSGRRLDGYAQDLIFDPLHMDATRFHPLDNICGPYDISGSAIELHTKLDERNGVGCSTNIWNSLSIPRTAPTAHDTEGTPATNPDFDHILRGTVHDPTTRRMGGVAGHAGVFSTAHDAAKFCQALLDKLTKNTGPFPLTQATLRLATSLQAPATAVDTATIFTQSGEITKGVAQRGLGWDLNSPFSRPRGTIFPLTTKAAPGSFGHTGFTGTSLWLDPTSDTYVILLANSIHPRVAASISALRGQVATAAAQALGLTSTSGAPRLASETWASSEARPPSSPQHTECPPSTICDNVIVTSSDGRLSEGERSEIHALVTPPQTLTGIDVLEQTHSAALKTLATAHKDHLRLALLTNQSGLDAQGRRTIDILTHSIPEITLVKLFSPEHGLYGKQDTEHLTTETDPTTHLPVISLYGPKLSDKHPKPADLLNLDAIVIDLQDAGVRFWTYETLLGYFLEAAAEAHIEIIVLDRPNPIAAVAPQGPTSDPEFASTYTAFLPIPLRHSLTFGELARYFNANLSSFREAGGPASPASQAALTVIPMRNYSRSDYYADTGLPWIPPSPNLKTPRAAILYPALGLTEQTNVSVGRGTPTPFEDLGASWMDSEELAAFLTARQIPGVLITPTTMTIAEDANHYPFHGQTIPGLHFEVTDRTILDSPELGLELLSALHHLYPTQFQLEKCKTLLANTSTLEALTQGQDPADIASTWTPALDRFRQATTPYLLYP